jgi:hypothetical protein
MTHLRTLHPHLPYDNSMRRQHYSGAPMRICGSLAVLLCCSVRAFGVSPSDLRFTLAVTRSPAIYRLGERIECELAFSTSKPGKYEIGYTGQPRSLFGGEYETFIASPADGAADSRVDLSQQLGFAFIGSILSSSDRLSSVPKVVRIDLNERLRFVSPGTYRFRRDHRESPSTRNTHRRTSWWSIRTKLR